MKKYLYSLVSIRKRLDKPLNELTTEDIKRFVAKLEGSDYKPWTKADLKTLLRFYLRWLGKG